MYCRVPVKLTKTAWFCDIVRRHQAIIDNPLLLTDSHNRRGNGRRNGKVPIMMSIITRMWKSATDEPRVEDLDRAASPRGNLGSNILSGNQQLMYASLSHDNAGLRPDTHFRTNDIRAALVRCEISIRMINALIAQLAGQDFRILFGHLVKDRSIKTCQSSSAKRD